MTKKIVQVFITTAVASDSVKTLQSSVHLVRGYQSFENLLPQCGI